VSALSGLSSTMTPTMRAFSWASAATSWKALDSDVSVALRVSSASSVSIASRSASARRFLNQCDRRGALALEVAVADRLVDLGVDGDDLLVLDALQLLLRLGEPACPRTLVALVVRRATLSVRSLASHSASVAIMPKRSGSRTPKIAGPDGRFRYVHRSAARPQLVGLACACSP
jgi:hypothetical protein